MVCADLNVERGGFPIEEIAEGTYKYRTTGIGFANVGGSLMALGVPLRFRRRPLDCLPSFAAP